MRLLEKAFRRSHITIIVVISQAGIYAVFAPYALQLCDDLIDLNRVLQAGAKCISRDADYVRQAGIHFCHNLANTFRVINRPYMQVADLNNPKRIGFERF